MKCAACGTDDEAGRKFCGECGAPLAAVCPACGGANAPQSKFCGECGASLTARTPVEPRADGVAPHTERRLVSVLFLDLVSFTTLSERRDAEDMRGLMDRYFDTARAAIERHGGVIEKFIGDAVMAVWGTPVTHEDDAERAVRAALELVDAVAALGASMDLPLQARAGVLTGEAATSPDAGNQGMVTGDMVNTASRLQSAAAPGSVFVGEATYRAASRAVAFEEVGDLELKGKEEPVRAWRALRVVAERKGQNRMTIEPPFVGRAEEMRLLKEMLHATGREGKPRVVSVTGIGGIGKSRLAWELLKYIDGLAETIWWHHGRCPSYGEGVTFWALGEMVRMRAGIAETDPPGVSRSKLAASVAEHVTDEDERHWLEPRLAFLLGLEERPAGGREELFAAWRTFFERISDEGTVAMVFEDLQWADAGLLDFIESMLEWSRGMPIFIVTLARPELAERRANWGAGQRNFLALHLESLPDPTMAELVRGMVPGADDATVTRIVERAEGVPLYAVETLRMLADRGVLRAGDRAYELTGDLGDIQVPETLHALIASRLDALAPEDRALMQDAAVLGKSFTLDALAAVAGQDPAAIEPRLLDLARKEFLVHEADPRSPERGQYAFVQSIIREVAYGILSKADRRSRHLAAAHHFEAADDDELAGVVAAHYVEALGATPDGPDADALAARARDWLGQAAGRATSLGSPDQALVFAEQALAITPAGAERADLLRRAAVAAGDALLPDQAITYFEEAIEELRVLGDIDLEASATLDLVIALSRLNRAGDIRSAAAALEGRIGDDAGELARAQLDHAIAYVHYYDDELDRCLVSIDRALPAYERAREWDRVQRALVDRANVLSNLGRHREATLLRRGMLATAVEENDLRTQAHVLVGLSLEAEDWGEALTLSLESAAVARRGGYGGAEMLALGNGVEFAVETGQWAVADEMLADLRSRSDVPPHLQDVTALNGALLAGYRGDVAAAGASFGSIRTETATSADHTLRAWYLRVRGVIALMAGDAATGFEETIGAADEEPLGPNAGPAAWWAGRAALWLGDLEKARRALAALPVQEGRWHAAARRGLEAGVDALEGHAREAAAAFDTVLASRLAAGDPFMHALTTTDAVAVLPTELVPEGAIETARAYLEELHAEPLLAQLTRAVRASER